MRGPSHDIEAEQRWLEMALRSARNVSSSPSELRALRWQAMETSHATVTRQPRKGKSEESEDDDCIKFIEAVPRLFGHKVKGDDEGKLHVGHVGRWLRAQGHRELAGRLRRATRVRNSSAHPVDTKQLLDDLAAVASGEASQSTTADGKLRGKAGHQPVEQKYQGGAKDKAQAADAELEEKEVDQTCGEGKIDHAKEELGNKKGRAGRSIVKAKRLSAQAKLDVGSLQSEGSKQKLEAHQDVEELDSQVADKEAIAKVGVIASQVAGLNKVEANSTESQAARSPSLHGRLEWWRLRQKGQIFLAWELGKEL